MKKEVVNFSAICLESQKVKVEHKNLGGLLHPFPISKWKWEFVTTNFIIKLLRTTKKHDSIMVVVDKLTKATHFILVKLAHKEANIAEIYT
jgi:hypothetical protein